MSKFQFGTAGAIQWIYGGGTVNLLPNYTTGEFNQSGDQADTTSGAQTWKTHNPTLSEWEWSLEMFFDDGSTNGTADFSHLGINSMGVLAIGPLGTVTGKPKFGGSATISKLDMPFPFADPLTLKISGKGNGTAYWTAGSAW